MTNNKQTYDWTKSGSFIKMLDKNQAMTPKRVQNRLLKGPLARAPKSSRSGYYPDKEEAEPIDLTRRYTTEENNAVSSYWKRRQEEEKKQEFNEQLQQYKQIQEAEKQRDEDFKNSVFGKINPITAFPTNNIAVDVLLSPAKAWLTKKIFEVKEGGGNFLQNSTQVHAQNITGRIQDVDQSMLEAEAHKYLAEQKLLMLKLIDQRNLHEEINGRDDVYYQFQKLIAQLIEKLKNTDPTILLLDDAYKERYVNEHSNTFLGIPYERISNFIGSATAYGEEGLREYKNNIRKKYTNKAKAAQEKEMLSFFMDTVDSDLLLKHAYNSADPNMRLLATRANNAIESNNTNLYNDYINQIKTKINQSPISQRLLYAETNPDYFLDGTTYTPEERNNLKKLTNKEDRIRYKSLLAKKRILSGYRKPTESEEYDNSLMDYESQIRQTDEVIKNAIANKKELSEDYKDTMEWQDTFKKYVGVGKGYKQLELIHLNDWIINPNYWLYCMPGTMGSSNSSPEGLIGQAIQYGSLIGGPIGAALGTLSSTPLQTKSGLDENYAETAERYLDKMLSSISTFDITEKGSDKFFKDLLEKAVNTYLKQGRSREWINEHCDITNEEGKKNLLADLCNGIISSTDPRLNKIQLDAMRGLTAMREADNMRTMGSMPIEIAAQMIPVDRLLRHFGTIRRAAKDSRILSKSFANRVVDREGRVIATTAGKNASVEATENAVAAGEKYANGFRKPKLSSMIDATLDAGEFGTTVGTLTGTGVVGNAVYGTALAGIRGTGKLAYRMLPKSQKEFLEAVQRTVGDKFLEMYDHLLPMGSFRRAATKYGIPSLLKMTINSISEATEEGVQYLNSKQDFSKYGFGGMSLGDLIINDWSQGTEVANSYAALLGLSDSNFMNDAEYWNNIKGGFALGGGHAGIIQIANTAGDAYRQYKTDNFIINSSLMNRKADLISRANDKALVQLVMKGRGDYALETLNDMESRDRRSDNPQYTQEDYDYKRQRINDIIAATNNNDVRDILKAHGIEYGTERYAAAISDITSINRSINDNKQQSTEISNLLNQKYDSKEYKKAVDEAINKLFVDNIRESLAYSHSISNKADEFVKLNLGEKGEDETEEQYAERKKALRRLGEELAETAIKQSFDYKTRLINSLKALYQLKAQHNTIEDWFTFANNKFNIRVKRPDAKLIHDSIDEQIKELKDILFDSYKNDFKGINKDEISDADLLKHIDGLSGMIKTNEDDEIIQLLKAQAMLRADAKVLTKHNNRFFKGIVRNENGTYEYNPARYLYNRDLLTQAVDAIQNQQEFTEVTFEESKYANKKTDKKDPYLERIDKILKADYENEQLDWMVEDIYNGDLVNELIKDDTDNYTDEDVEKGTDSLINTFKPDDVPAEEIQSKKLTSHVLESTINRTKQERRHRIAKAKRKWRERRKQMRKNRRSRLGADITGGILPMLQELATILFEGILIASYKIQDFLEDAKYTMGSNWKDEYTQPLTRIYNREKAKSVLYNNTPEQQDVKSLRQILEERSAKVDTEASSFFDTIVNDNGITTIYSNFAWQHTRKLFSGQDYLNIVSEVEKASKSQEEFDKILKNHNIPQYSKYRNVNGIVGAIARRIVHDEYQEEKYGIKPAINIRAGIINYITTGELKIDLDVPLDRIDELLRYLNNMRTFIDRNKLYIIDTSRLIYGTDKDGNNISTEADILMVDPEGNIYMWDVSQSIHEFNEAISPNNLWTWTDNRERAEIDNKALYDILTNTLGQTVANIKIIPIMYNPEDHILVYEGSFNITPDQLNSIHYNDHNANEINGRRKPIVETVNKLVDECNYLLKQFGYDLLEHEPDVFIDDSAEAYIDIQRLFDRAEQIRSLHTELVSKLDSNSNNKISAEEEEYIELNQPIAIDTEDEQRLDLIRNLSNLCANLDRELGDLSGIVGNIDQTDVDTILNVIKLTKLVQYLLNTVLSNNKLYTQDVTKEQQLIFSALEHLILLSDKCTTNIKEQILNLQNEVLSLIFDVADYNISTYSFSKLNAINNALFIRETDGNIHIYDDIKSYPKLISMYYDIINNQYNLMIQSAEAILKKDTHLVLNLIEYAENLISEGKTAIEQFNETFGTFEEDETTIHDINSANVEHKDLYNTTTSVHPSRSFMLNLDFYHEQLATTFPNFIINSEFDLIDDDKLGVCLVVKYDKNESGKYRYEYKIPFYDRFDPIYMESIAPFIDKIKKMIAYRNSHPNAKIKFDVFRNKGSVLYTHTKFNNMFKYLFDNGVKDNSQLYNFKMDQNTRFGIIVVEQRDGKEHVKINTGTSLLIPLYIMDNAYDKKNSTLSPGTIMFLYDTRKAETINIEKSKYLPMSLSTKLFGEDIAKNLVNIIYSIAKNRNYTYAGHTYMPKHLKSMLELVLYTGTERVTKYNNTSNAVKINGNIVTIGNELYNITDVETAKRLVDKLKSMYYQVQADNVNEYFLTWETDIMRLLKTMFAEDKSLLTIKLPIGFDIQREDFEHENKGSANGTTLFGYLLRNQILGTHATGFGYCELNVDNVVLIDENTNENVDFDERTNQLTQNDKQISDEEALDLVNENLGYSVSRDKNTGTTTLNYSVDQQDDRDDESDEGTDYGALMSGWLTMTSELGHYVLRDQSEQTSFLDKARAYFDKVLGGNKGEITFGPSDSKYLEGLGNGNVLGACAHNAIELSLYAPESAIFHEAFHKIIELCLPEETRDEFYQAYRKKYGEGLSERDVAEGLCDIFVNYINDKTLFHSADSVFKKIKKFFAFFIRILGIWWRFGISKGNKMMNTVIAADAGAYKNVEISEDRIRKFEERFGERLFYQVTNHDSGEKINFKSVTNSTELREAAEAISYIILKYYGAFKKNGKINGDIVIDNDLVDKLLGDEYIYKNFIKSRLNGKNPFVRNVFNEIFMKYQYKTYEDTKDIKYGVHTLKTKKVYQYFNALKPYIYEYIQSIVKQYEGRFVDEDEPSTDDDNAMTANIDKFDKSAYEFSKLDSVNKRVKMFFSTLVYRTKNLDYENQYKWYEEHKDAYKEKYGKDLNPPQLWVTDYSRSKFGLPVLMPLNEVFNIVTNDLGHVSTVEELYEELKKKAQTSPMYFDIFDKFDYIYQKQTYDVEVDGKKETRINYDNEAFITQIFGCIKSQNIDFFIVKSDTEGDTKTTRMIRSGFDLDAINIPSTWEGNLLNGAVSIISSIKDALGRYMFTKDGVAKLKKCSEIISQIANLCVSTTGTKGNIDGFEYDTANYTHIELLKDKLIDSLNRLGIMFSREALDYMLERAYKSTDKNGLNLFLNTTTDRYSLRAFLNTIEGFYNKTTEAINIENVNTGYKNVGFVKELANWQGLYNGITTDNSAYGLNGKRLFKTSQNHTISHVVNQLNKSIQDGLNTKYVDLLSNFSYSLLKDGSNYKGSIVLKAIANNSDIKINLSTYLGFKTDQFGDNGTEFLKEPEIDDYIAKLTMLLNGAMVFYTLADKGTWVVAQFEGDSNVKIPGMNFRTINKNTDPKTGRVTKKEVFVNNVPSIVRYTDSDGVNHTYLRPTDAVLDQFLEYANCEIRAIQECMESLGYNKIYDYTKTGKHVLTEKEKVNNYNKGKFPNGTRFLSLTKLIIPGNLTEDGNPKEECLNDLSYSDNAEDNANEMLKRAIDNLFYKLVDGKRVARPIEELRQIMAATLNILNEFAMEYATLLGIISHENGHYLNKNLDQNLINKVFAELKSQSQNEGLTDEDIKDLAIRAILGDVTNRSIISAEEWERLVSGHPGFFKVKYGEDGKISDSTGDKQKRVGGMISTGDDNRPNMFGIDETYICAECNDYEVGSKAAIYPRLKEMFKNGQLREAYGNYFQDKYIDQFKSRGINRNSMETLHEQKWYIDKFKIKHEDECKGLTDSEIQDLVKEHVLKIIKKYDKDIQDIWNNAYTISHDEIKKLLPEKIYNKAINLANSFASAYDKKINVADGAAYITEEMCEKLLRKRGAYSNQVAKAFLTLKDPNEEWVHKYKAYKVISEATVMVTTKYTAYGMRQHETLGIPIPYYNKYALFPLFDCVATGKMRGIYDKMKNEGVDMLMMTSAVKLGSQGAVSYDGNAINEPFNKYEQSFDFLRRQLNTDPEEEHELAFGTQMIKLVMANLRLERNNYGTGENKMSGKQIRDAIMYHIKELSKLGVERFRNRFYNENGELNQEKVADYLRQQLDSKGANRTILEAFDMVQDGIANAIKQSMPLAATPDPTWIESILISSANKDIINIVTPGNSFVQRSVFGIENEDEDNKERIEAAHKETRAYYNGQKLEMINNKNCMDAVISMDFFEDILPKGLSFEEQRLFLIDNKIIGKDADALIIGYRIPTQAQSSIHALRILDVVPAVKSTVILPLEFTKITGSD